MWRYELTLNKKSYTKDSIGNQVPIITPIVVFCDKKSIGRSEFYNAAVADLKPEIIFVVHTWEYDGETEVEFDGVRYKIIRTYSASEKTELVCEKVIGNG
jgi:SPP1 family predicted phage head-tail adaptor